MIIYFGTLYRLIMKLRLQILYDIRSKEIYDDRDFAVRHPFLKILLILNFKRTASHMAYANASYSYLASSL